MRRYWGDLTSEAVGELGRLDAVAAVVLGAVEQHGPHLPLATDSIIGEGLLEAASGQLADDFPLIVLPTLAIGASEEHTSFAGTLSFSAKQMHEQVVALGEGLHRCGLRRFVLVNAHGGNAGWMEDAALDLRSRLGLLVVKASYMRFAPPEEDIPAGELRDGLHGGLVETAMMLHLAPDTVRMDRAERFAPRHPQAGELPPQGEAAWAWRAEDLNEAGVVGNAAEANASLGRALVEHYAGRLARILRACREKDWPHGGRRPAAGQE
jgi:creatinine amidohydrolase